MRGPSMTKKYVVMPSRKYVLLPAKNMWKSIKRIKSKKYDEQNGRSASMVVEHPKDEVPV